MQEPAIVIDINVTKRFDISYKSYISELRIGLKEYLLTVGLAKLKFAKNFFILDPRMTEPSTEGPGFVGIRFCQECNNMLYPKEDKVVLGPVL